MAASGYTPILIYASGTASNVPLAANLTSSASGAELALNYADGKLYFKNSSGVVTLLASSAGASGDVVGPASATDNALARFDLTTGKLIQNSVGILSDAGALSGLTDISASGNVTLSGGTANGVAYLNGSKVLTTGSALTFDGTNLTVPAEIYRTSATSYVRLAGGDAAAAGAYVLAFGQSHASAPGRLSLGTSGTGSMLFDIGGSEQMRLTSTGLGIGITNPANKLVVSNGGANGLEINPTSGVSSGASLNGYNRSTSAFTPLTYTAIAHYFQTGSSPATAATLDSSGNLGIGTSSPQSKIQVNPTGAYGIGTISNAGLNISPTNITGGFATGSVIWTNYALGGTSVTAYISAATYGNNYMDFSASGTATQMRLDSSGNLGLGVTPSTGGYGVAFQFAQAGDGGALTAQAISANNYPVNLTANAISSGASTWKYFNTDASSASRYQQVAGAHQWFTAPSGTAGNAITFTQAMTLDASGNLGLGETSPSQRLHVKTSSSSISLFDSTETNGGFLTFSRSGTPKGYIGSPYHLVIPTGSNDDFAVRAVNNLILVTGTAERARIDSSGNFLVAQTIQGPANSYSMCYGAGNTGGLDLSHLNGAASGTMYERYNYNATTIGSITQNGTTGVLYNITSDQRLKENIVDAPAASSLIDDIQVRSFDWKSDGSHQRYGFIAQELVAVAPEAVHQPVNPDEMMGVDYSKLVPMLVKEIQSLRQRVAQLEGK